MLFPAYQTKKSTEHLTHYLAFWPQFPGGTEESQLHAFFSGFEMP